jgi:histidine triad (HIT) family protein
MSTIFKKIIDKEIPAKVIYEDDLCLAFHDVSPQAPTHVLMIPKKEIRSMAEVTAADKELLGHMFLKCSQVAAQLGVAEKGYRLVVNTNSWGGQTVFHLHIHLLAGRSLSWPPG